VLRQRISRAKQLLMESDMSVTEISYLLGFATPAHFTYHSRRQTDVTPSDLRRGL
jgi:AraC family transcriptional regulator